MSENIPPSNLKLDRTKSTKASDVLQPQRTKTDALFVSKNTTIQKTRLELSKKPVLKEESNEIDHKATLKKVDTQQKKIDILQDSENKPKREKVLNREQADKKPKQDHEAEKIPEKDKELEDRHDLEGYEKISKIGEGTYGVVYKARQKTSNNLVAMKKIRLNSIDGVSTTTVREVAMLKEMKHENIIQMIDTIQRDTAIYLVFNYSDIDLRKYMEKVGRKGLTINHIKSFMHQLLNGIYYCHSHRVLHRDLKPGNLLIDRYGRLTIADLGLSRTFGVPMRTYTHQVITLWYRAPEILLGSRHYSTAVDMWSIGCILAELISMVPQFTGSSQIDQLFRIFRKLGTPTEEVWPGVSALPDYNENFPPWKAVDLRGLLESYECSIVAPDSAYDLLNNLLTYDPVSRMSAKKALEHFFFYDDPSILKF